MTLRRFNDRSVRVGIALSVEARAGVGVTALPERNGSGSELNVCAGVPGFRDGSASGASFPMLRALSRWRNDHPGGLMSLALVGARLSVAIRTRAVTNRLLRVVLVELNELAVKTLGCHVSGRKDGLVSDPEFAHA
jgi:hypothetical protein